MALPKKHRFLNRGEIQNIIRYGQRRTLALGRVIFRFSHDSPSPRFLVVVPNSVSKKSTVRHRLKRQLESLFYFYKNLFPTGLDIVCILAPAAAKFSKKELNSEFMNIVYILKRT